MSVISPVTRRVLRNIAASLLLAALLVVPAFPGIASQANADWLSSANRPDELRLALAAHPEKIPVEFYDRLQYALPTGSLRVIGVLTERTPATEELVAVNTVEAAWYENQAAFLGNVLPDQFTALLNDPRVSFLEPDFKLTYNLAQSVVTTKARSSGTGSGVWYWDTTTSSYESDVAALATATTGSTATAAIIDSGVDRTHKDFSGTGCAPSSPMSACNSRIKLNVKLEASSSAFVAIYPSDALPTTDLASGHGTHVAGIVAGNGWYSRNGYASGVPGYTTDSRAFGVAPEASLVVITNGDTLWAGMADSAMTWVKNNHAAYDIKVTSNSWGCVGGCAYSASSLMSILVKDLYDAGVVSVFAVGNEGGTGSGSEFSGYAQSPYVIGVAAHGRTDKVADFSSRGSSSTSNSLPSASTWTPTSAAIGAQRRPDVAAPGVDIRSARGLLGGAASLLPRVMTQDVTGANTLTATTPYVSMSGTSMATPHVTGAVLLLFDECPSATPLEIMRAIFAGADPNALDKTTSTATAEPFEVGYGKLDARASLNWIMANVSGC